MHEAHERVWWSPSPLQVYWWATGGKWWAADTPKQDNTIIIIKLQPHSSAFTLGLQLFAGTNFSGFRKIVCLAGTDFSDFSNTIILFIRKY